MLRKKLSRKAALEVPALTHWWIHALSCLEKGQTEKQIPQLVPACVRQYSSAFGGIFKPGFVTRIIPATAHIPSGLAIEAEGF